MHSRDAQRERGSLSPDLRAIRSGRLSAYKLRSGNYAIYLAELRRCFHPWLRKQQKRLRPALCFFTGTGQQRSPAAEGCGRRSRSFGADDDRQIATAFLAARLALLSAKSLKMLTKARRSNDAAKSLQMLAKTPLIHAV